MNDTRITVQTGLRLESDGVRDAFRFIFHGDEPHEDIGIIIPVNVWEQLVTVINGLELDDDDSDANAFTISWPDGWNEPPRIHLELDS